MVFKKTYFLLLIIFSCGMFSQEIRFTKIGIKDGLPSANITSIVQDKFGFMWIGTSEGLCRYDGYSFKLFRNNPLDSNSLLDNHVNNLVFDNNGNLWVSSRSKGLCMMNPVTFKFRYFLYDNKDSTGINYRDVRSICKDQEGTMWIGTARGLNRYNEKNENFTQYNTDLNKEYPGNIFAILPEGKDNIWIGSHGSGVHCFNKVTGKFKHFYNESGNPASLSHNAAVSLGIDAMGKLWVGTRDEGGINVFDVKSNSFSHLVSISGNETTISGNDFLLAPMFLDSQNNFWVGTFQNGLNLFKKQSLLPKRIRHDVNNNSSISSENIRCVFEDKGGLIWIGTSGGGINIYDPKKNVFEVFQHHQGNKNSISGNSINALAKDSLNRIWIAQKNTIDLLLPSVGTFSNINDIAQKNIIFKNEIHSLAIDKLNRMWVAEYGTGLKGFFLNMSELKASDIEGGNIPESLKGMWPTLLFSDSKGNLWISDNGLNLYAQQSSESGIFRNKPKDNSSLSVNNVTALLESKNGGMWVGTSEGLNFLDIKNKTFKRWQNDSKNQSGIISDMITYLYEDYAGNIWIGTDKGLDKFDAAKNTFIHFNSGNGLENESITSIIGDDNQNLWIGTTFGLFKFDPAKNTFQKFEESEGLPGFSFSSSVLKHGKYIYFGMNEGLVRLNPENLLPNNNVPKIAITAISILNKPLHSEKDLNLVNEINLTYNDHFFSIEFAALDFSCSNKNKYKYKLEGFNDEWVELGTKREVTFTNLDPKEYKLKIRAANNYGLWSEEDRSITVRISPPWWKTKLFYASVIVFIILSIYIYVKFRERKLEAEKKNLELQVDLRTKQLRDEKEKVLQASEEISEQKRLIEEKQKEILDSIHYAQRIQKAHLPNEKFILKVLERLKKG